MPEATALIHLVTTVGGRGQALELARAAVDARVAACVQVIGPITSIYRWEGRVDEAEEYLCLLKAPAEGLERLSSFVRERHPYDTPEITAVPATWVDERYMGWVAAETAP